ncbi:MAG TPA: hypothetical protein VMI55_05415 [Thermoplasmata archaeon]|nr:hypothetical protein [Thermoplasmata archaeon]
MRLWAALYLMIWVVFLEFLLAMIPLAPGIQLPLHAMLGLVIVGVAYYNFAGLRSSRAPGRLKLIAKTTLWLAFLMVFLGIALLLNVGFSWNVPVLNVSVYHTILFFHIVNAFAIITQSASVATAYDMWEEREFEKGTEPGDVPSALPAPPARASP